MTPERAIVPCTLGPWSRMTTPGSGPTFQRQATARPPIVTRAGREAAGTKSWTSCGWPVRSSRAPFVARKPARPGCVSSSTPHQEPVAVRRLNGTTAPARA